MECSRIPTFQYFHWRYWNIGIFQESSIPIFQYSYKNCNIGIFQDISQYFPCIYEARWHSPESPLTFWYKWELLNFRHFSKIVFQGWNWYVHSDVLTFFFNIFYNQLIILFVWKDLRPISYKKQYIILIYVLCIK